MGISPLAAGVWLLAGRGAGSWPPSRALQGSPPSPVPLYRGPGSAAEPRDNSALSVEHHEHMVGNRPPPDVAQLSAARDSLPRDRVFGPLNLPCCTCAAGPLAAAAAPPAQLTSMTSPPTLKRCRGVGDRVPRSKKEGFLWGMNRMKWGWHIRIFV